MSESNDRGSWFGFQVEKGEQVTDSSIYNEGKLFSTAASSGAVEAKPEETKAIAKPQTTESNVDIPF